MYPLSRLSRVPGPNAHVSPLSPLQGAWAGYNPEAQGSALYPNEVASDFAFIPFGGGARKCIGDQFALFEATVAMAMLLRRFTFKLAVPASQVSGRDGANEPDRQNVCD